MQNTLPTKKDIEDLENKIKILETIKKTSSYEDFMKIKELLDKICPTKIFL